MAKNFYTTTGAMSKELDELQELFKYNLKKDYNPGKEYLNEMSERLMEALEKWMVANQYTFAL